MCAVTRANDGMSATKRSNRTLRSFALAAAVTLATLVTAGLGARNAEAALYVNSGYDMRAFVATGTPLFTCGTGYLGLGQISVRAPTNLGPVTAYVTYYLSTTNSLGQWYALTPTGTPEPGGYRFAPGGLHTFRAFWMTTPAAGYYYGHAQVDFHYTNGPSFGKVDIYPTTTSDWSSAFRYQGQGYSYCYHN